MPDQEIRIQYEEFSSLEDCPLIVQEMVQKATVAANKAYAVYSQFNVGAAIELASGEILTASNQENKAYPSGLCAERSVLFYAHGQDPELKVKRIVVIAFDKNGLVTHPVFPCGACRQVMVETEERSKMPLETWMIGANNIIKTNSMDALMPFKFSF